MRLATAPALTFMLLLTACGGPELADLDTGSVSIALSGVSTTPEVAALGEPAGGLGVTRAFVSASALSVLPCRANAAAILLSARGYDLLTSPPPDEQITTAVTELCALRLDIDPLAKNALDGVPKGSSLYVEGTQSDGAGFSLTSSSSSSLVLQADAGSSFGELPLLLGFDVSVWLDGLDGGALDDPASADVSAAFDAQLRSAVALYADANGNHALDADELTPVARAAPSR
jgi:hypothetical protein